MPCSGWHVRALLAAVPLGFSVKRPCLKHHEAIYGIPETVSHESDSVLLSLGVLGFLHGPKLWRSNEALSLDLPVPV